MSSIPEGGVPGMEHEPPAYRVIIVSSDGVVQQSVPLPVDSDDAAKRAAERLATGNIAELWDGLRFIERFEAKQKT